MSGPLYVIAGLLATAAIAGVGFLIREYLRLSVAVRTEEAETEAQKARADRILKEKEAYEDVHKTRALTGSDAVDRL
jgi:hypothetical protein